MSRLPGIISKKRNIIYFCLFLIAAVGASVVLASMAAERAGMYWIGLDDRSVVEKSVNSRGFMMVDVSDLSSMGGMAEASDRSTEMVPIGIGPLPNVPTLTTEELKLYGILSRGDGLILSEDKHELDEDIHWNEVVLEPGDTLSSIAKEYGVSADDIRRANGLAPNQKLSDADMLYVPDSKEYVPQTLAYVNKLKKAESDLAKRGKPLVITDYVVKQGDSLWSIASKFNLELDTIIGSNSLKDINMLKPDSTLRIPNQDGIFVKVTKKDTVAKLADKYGSFKDSVYVANVLDENKPLAAGEEIFLPGGKMVASVESPSRKAVKYNTKTIISSSRRFRWPLMGQISSVYGWRRSPFGRRRVFHSGVDIRAPRGRSIISAGDGRVVHSGWMGGYGKTVVVLHTSGLATLYGHCSSISVSSGSFVRRGDVIARVGSTGRSTGNHLHFEVRRNGSPVNPLQYLR